MTRPPSAAQALYGHLPRAEPVERPQRNTSSLGAAMWPSLGPQPKPASNPYRASTAVSLAALADENPWLEARLAMSGLRRIR